MGNDDKLIATRHHPLYDKYAPDWVFFLQAYKGGTDYRNANLFTHRLENATDYANRRARAYYLNYCRPLPDIYTDYVFREPATRPGNFSPDVMKNINGRGKNVVEFMQICSTLSSIYGQLTVLIDKPVETPEQKTSKATATKPYAIIYPPQNVVDWSVDPHGDLNWVLFYEPILVDTDPMVARANVKRFRLVTREGWKVFEAGEEDKVEMKSQGLWPDLGIVPVATCIHKDIDEDMIGESMLADIAAINRIIFNWCSLIDEQIERQTFSQLTMPDTGEGGESNLERTGTAQAFTYPATAKFPPAYISPDTAQISVIWEMIEKHIAEIYRQALLDKNAESIITAQSGISKAYDFVDTNQAISSKASQMQKFENKVNGIIAKWEGTDTPESVQYPKEFDVISLERDIKNSLDLVSENISETFNKVLHKRLVRKSLKSISAADLKTIDKEINEGSTIPTTDVDTEHMNDEKVHGPEVDGTTGDETTTE